MQERPTGPMPQKMPMRFTADYRDRKAAMRAYEARLWNEDAGRAAELAYLDRILERLESPRPSRRSASSSSPSSS